MEEKSLRKQFARYLLPSVASLVSLSLYILADTYFIANGVGSVGLAALNISIPAYSIVNALALMFGIGGGVVVAVSRGRKDGETAQKAFGCALALAVLTGAIFTLLGALFAERIALLLGASPLSLEYATIYIRIILLYAPAFMINGTLVALVRNDGNPRLSMISMMVNSFANVILDYIFVMVLDMGMWGAAFATGLSASSGILILSLHWILGYNTLRLEKKLPDFRMTGSILKGGVSNFITELGNGLVILLFNYTLMALSGDVAVAAYGIVTNISLVISYVFIGIGQGMQPVIGLNFGEGKRDNCRKVLWMALALAGVLGVLFYLAGLLFPHQLTAAFNGDGDPVLAAITVRAMRIYFLCFIFMGVNICCASYFQSMLHAKSAMIISLLRSCFFVVVGVAVLPRLWQLDGVWAITPMAEVLTVLVSAGLLLRMEDKKKTHPEGVGESAAGNEE